MAAAVEQLEQGRRRRQSGTESEAAAAAFETGDAALIGETGRIVGPRIFETLVDAGAGLGVGRGRVDRRHHRAGTGVRRLPGMDGLGAQAVRPPRFARAVLTRFQILLRHAPTSKKTASNHSIGRVRLAPDGAAKQAAAPICRCCGRPIRCPP